MSYANASTLKFASHLISSEEGIQQGDPLGPFLFCLAIHHLLQSLNSELIISYMDDITLAGSTAVVAKDVEAIISSGASSGLHLNVSKCECITSSSILLLSPLNEFMQLHVDDATLLGAPLSRGTAMNIALQKRLHDLTKAKERLRLLSSHVALFLLKASCGSPKLTHLLRSSPCSGQYVTTV